MTSRFFSPFGPNRFAGSEPFVSLQREMSRLVDDVLSPRLRPDLAFSPAVDLSETAREVRVVADLPGVSEDEVHVSLDDDLLIIRGERRRDRTREKDNVRFSERSYGGFYRAVRVPHEIDADAISATFENGVLTIVLPKDPRAVRGRRIEVQGRAGDSQGGESVVDQQTAATRPPPPDEERGG